MWNPPALVTRLLNISWPEVTENIEEKLAGTPNPGTVMDGGTWVTWPAAIAVLTAVL